MLLEWFELRQRGEESHMSRKINSLELFKRLQPKFREITWHANGFTTEEPYKFVVEGLILRNENLLLVPGFLGKDEPIPSTGHTPGGQMYSTWWSDYGTGQKDCRPSFQFREGNLAFNFAFDPSVGKAMKYQLEKAAERALLNGPFKGRRFFMDPKLRFHHRGLIDVEFHTDGHGPISGLYLGEATAHDWTFFIPEGPERRAIQAAIDLEHAQDEQVKYHEQDPVRSTVQELQIRFEKSLSAIAM
ncbi:MAG: hypothetical protein B7X03_02520 [Parcubacteria group bacterium 21-58-10]|nr:MAG: hypothetical protein B7X03_02520 [Parcubacteria group bacterium 21-58-10]